MSLSDISVKTLEQPTGMAQALLHELLDALQLLADSGTSNAIDLRSLPLTEADTAQLAELLGKGELSARIDSIGHSQVQETSYSGIWWISHYGGDGELLAEILEITTVPQLLVSHADDIRYAV
ncbi:MAG: hydrogenase expression/formation C-terminal domain-containing protein, partial [Chromatiales bacterium]